MELSVVEVAEFGVAIGQLCQSCLHRTDDCNKCCEELDEITS